LKAIAAIFVQARYQRINEKCVVPGTSRSHATEWPIVLFATHTYVRKLVIEVSWSI